MSNLSEEEAILYLEHTAEDDFNLEEHQRHNRYLAIKTILDLYNKEKNEVLHWKGQYHLLSRKIGVISENKITKRIEEIKKIFPNDIMFTREFLITELKGLLEE